MLKNLEKKGISLIKVEQKGDNNKLIPEIKQKLSQKI